MLNVWMQTSELRLLDQYYTCCHSYEGLTYMRVVVFIKCYNVVNSLHQAVRYSMDHIQFICYVHLAIPPLNSYFI